MTDNLKLNTSDHIGVEKEKCGLRKITRELRINMMPSIRYTARRETINNTLFFLAFGIFLVSEILMTSVYAQYISELQLRVIRYTWLFFLVIREFFISKEYSAPTLIRLLFHNVKWLIAFALVIIFTIVLKFTTSNNLVFFVVIFALSARSINFDRIAKISFWIMLGAVAFVICSCYLGIINNYIQSSSAVSRGQRQCLGFLCSLYPSMYLFNLTALLLYFRKKRITWIEMAIMILLNVWMYLQTFSRLAFIMSILIILVFAFLKIKPEFLKGKRVLCGLMVLSFLICFAGTLVLVLMYSDSSPVMEQVNIVLSKRLSLLQRSISNDGIHLFGQQLFMIGNGLNAATGEKAQGEYSYVDSYYLQFLLRNGIIFTIICFVLLTVAMYLIYRSGNYTLLVCLAFIAVGLTIDDLLSRLCFNPFLILIGSSMLQRFMSQHEDNSKFFPGDEGKLVSGMNKLFS